MINSNCLWAKDKMVKLEISLSKNGDTISDLHSTVILGKEEIMTFVSKVGHKKNFIKVLANSYTMQGQKGLIVKMEIGEYHKKEEILLWRPEVFTLDGQSTEFNVLKKSRKNDLYTIQVTPTLL